MYRLVQVTATLFALVTYLGAFLYTARTIFPPLPPGGPPRVDQKRSMTNTVVCLFALLAMLATTVTFIEIVSPASNPS